MVTFEYTDFFADCKSDSFVSPNSSGAKAPVTWKEFSARLKPGFYTRRGRRRAATLRVPLQTLIRDSIGLGPGTKELPARVPEVHTSRAGFFGKRAASPIQSSAFSEQVKRFREKSRLSLELPGKSLLRPAHVFAAGSLELEPAQESWNVEIAIGDSA